MKRPFYAEFAWAYDVIIADASTERIPFIEQMLISAGIEKGARILDAGCGTGNYAIALAQCGYSVQGLDREKSLLHEAQRKIGTTDLDVTLLEGSILALSPYAPIDAILCRGVLNDLTDTPSRQDVFVEFAHAVRPGGVLIFDVRHWDTTVARKTHEPVSEKSVVTAKGRLTFRSVTAVEPTTQSLFVDEYHCLEQPAGKQEYHWNFTMKCWTRDELGHALSRAGFLNARYFGDYDVHTPIESTDRIVGVATRGL